MAKTRVNFTIDEDLWRRFKELQERLPMKVYASTLVEDGLRSALPFMEELAAMIDRGDVPNISTAEAFVGRMISKVGHEMETVRIKEAAEAARKEEEQAAKK